MPLSPIDTASFRKIAEGIDRPEDVVVSAGGRVFASDHQCAVAEILPDGSFLRMGPKGGAPNGINMDRQGRILIANFGIYDREEGRTSGAPTRPMPTPGPRRWTAGRTGSCSS